MIPDFIVQSFNWAIVELIVDFGNGLQIFITQPKAPK